MENNKRPTQSERVLKYMQTNGWITQYEAMTELGVMRLAIRVAKKRGKNSERIYHGEKPI